jgi:hypothetical protein
MDQREIHELLMVYKSLTCLYSPAKALVNAITGLIKIILKWREIFNAIPIYSANLKKVLPGESPPQT